MKTTFEGGSRKVVVKRWRAKVERRMQQAKSDLSVRADSWNSSIRRFLGGLKAQSLWIESILWFLINITIQANETI
jgi:hypothetical protein